MQRVDNGSGSTGIRLTNLWHGLSNEATATLIPLGPAPFAPLYGMLTDRFGVTWLVGVNA